MNINNFGEVEHVDPPHPISLAEAPDANRHGAVTRLSEQAGNDQVFSRKVERMPAPAFVSRELDHLGMRHRGDGDQEATVVSDLHCVWTV